LLRVARIGWWGLMLLGMLPCLYAQTSFVTTTNDSGPGSLRQAILDANFVGGTIEFSNVTGTILLTSGDLVINTPMTIIGPGPTNLFISGGNSNRVFEVHAADFAIIQGLGIINGKGGDGPLAGGGLLNTGFLSLTNCLIANNATTIPIYYYAAGSGGGIGNSGTLILSHCTVVSNTTSINDGDPAYFGSGAGIYNVGSMQLFSCDISFNSTPGAEYSGPGGDYV
jgi:hypothetical protein